MGLKYRTMEDQKPGPELGRNQDFAKGQDLNQSKKIPKMSQLRNAASKLM